MSLRDLWHLRPVAKFRHSYVILICSADFADRQWACPSKGTGNPLHFWRSSKLGQLCYVSFFQLSNFCLNCQKRWNFAGTRCKFDKWFPIKFFRLHNHGAVLTFQTSLQASIFQYWLTASQPPIPMRTIHPLLLARKIPFTYSKPQVIRIMSQIPQRHFPKERFRLVYKYAQCDRELLELDIDKGESAKKAFSSGNTGPQGRVARMGHNHKTNAIFLRFVLRSVSETKVKVFPTRK